jgi:polar amino acid transport system substrate-binding protein
MARPQSPVHASRRVPALLLAISALCPIALGRVEAAEPLQLKIATEAANPPFTYRDAAGEPQGFEIDLAKAFCEAMRAECSFLVRQWEGIFRDLLKGDEYDAVVSSVAITPRRRARIGFSIPYYRLPSSFLGRRDGSVQEISKEALKGRVVGVVENSPQAAYLAAHHPEAEARAFAKVDEAILDLLAQRIDVVLTGKIAATNFLGEREGDCCRILGDADSDPAVFGEGVAVGLRPGDIALKKRFDAAIRDTVASGAYDRIRQRYLPFDVK